MRKVSRHRLAVYISEELAGGTLDSPKIRQIAAYLVEQKLVRQLDLLLNEVSAILASRHGIVLAEITSARQLTDDIREMITSYIAEAERAEAVELSERVNPDLIGGVIIRTPSEEFDSSIRTQIKTLSSIKLTRSN